MLVTLLLFYRTGVDSFTTAWILALPGVAGFENRPPTKQSVHLGGNRLPTFETPATASTADASLLRQGHQRRARTRVLCVPCTLGAMTQGVWSSVPKRKKGGVS